MSSATAPTWPPTTEEWPASKRAARYSVRVLVIERAPGEPVPEAAERTLVGATGVHADRCGGELAGRLPDGQAPLPLGVPFECGSHLCPGPPIGCDKCNYRK